MRTVASNLLTPGMTISQGGKLFRVESAVKVATSKGAPFIKTKLRNLSTDVMSEKNFKLDQEINEVSLVERTLEYLYLEGDQFLFLDIDDLEHILVPAEVVGDRVVFLKEGIEIKATCYGETVFAVELPQFLEIMVSKTEEVKSKGVPVANASRVALLESGAKLEVPPFIEAGDIIKVDTRTGEFIQRV